MDFTKEITFVLKEKDLELKDMFSLQPRNWSAEHRDDLTDNRL